MPAHASTERRPVPGPQAHQAHARPIASQHPSADTARDFNFRPEASLQARFADLVQASPRVAQLRALQAQADARLFGRQLPSAAATVQRALADEEEHPAQRAEKPAAPSRSGLPDTLKSGIESLSGMSMDHVKVHYNSSRPAQLNALAYAQGSDIHVAPGQEKHLPHEAWHVVQQAQGRVRPTMQMQAGVAVNDDTRLEREADGMGARALQSGQPIQRRAVAVGELPGAKADGDGAIFDSKITTGLQFEVEESVPKANWASVIGKYQQAIRPLGDAMHAETFTDTNLTFGANLPSAKTWGQKKKSFIEGDPPKKGARDELKMAAGVDKDTGDHAFWKTLAEGVPKAQRNSLRNRADIGLIDPFLVSVVVADESGKSAGDWRFITQFADSGAGYIKQIHNGRQNLGGSIETAQSFAASKDTATLDDRGYGYSSTHDQGAENFDSRIKGVASGKTKHGDNSKGLDAVTWLAAEGARFGPVAALGGKGSPESHYFIKPNADWTGYKYYTAIMLMQSWGRDFGKRYGVTTATMRGVVTAQGKSDVAEPPKGWHYNLTTGAEYEKP